MNIGFDLDKVFIAYPPFLPSVLFDKLYKEKDNGVLLYRIPTYPEQQLRKLLHLPILRPGIKENLEFLRGISKKEHKLYLISSRYKFLEGATKKLIKKHGFDKIFDGMYFNFENEQAHVFKNRIIKQLHLDYYVDDDLSLLKHVAKDNLKTKFFWFTSHAGGKHLPENISAISKLSRMIDVNHESRN